MNPLNTLGTLIDSPELLTAEEKPAGLGRTGMLGYLLGTFGVFMFLRLYSAVPPGIMSFCVVLALVLALNFFMAGVINLFMDLTGSGSRAGRLFKAFGLTDYLLTLLVPLGMLAKAGVLGGFLDIVICAALIIYTRVKLVRRLYPVSANKATLSVLLPYAGLFTALFLASVYLFVWMIWLSV